jgi:hypothetical protein
MIAAMNIRFNMTHKSAPLRRITPKSRDKPVSNSTQGKMIATILVEVIGSIRNAATASENSAGLRIFPIPAHIKTAANKILQINTTVCFQTTNRIIIPALFH